MEQTAEQAYTELLRQLDSPMGKPEVLADMFRKVERMHSTGQIEDWQMQNAQEAYARTTGSRIGDAAHWAVGKASDTLHSTAEHVRERAATAVATYTDKDPVRAILIAAGVGAVLMGLVTLVARAGARRVRRKFTDEPARSA